jgi:hypothetical protein
MDAFLGQRMIGWATQVSLALVGRNLPITAHTQHVHVYVCQGSSWWAVYVARIGQHGTTGIIVNIAIHMYIRRH